MPAEIDLTVAHRPQRRARRVDTEIVELGERQYGVVSRAQLAALGLSEGAIKQRVAHGWLWRTHRGVFAVGRRTLTLEGRWAAALLALGPDAVLTHRAAGAFWGIRGSQSVEVTVPHDRRAPRGVIVHRSCLPPDEVTEQRGLAVTTVPRTLLDLAEVLPKYELERAINEAEHQRLLDTLSLGDVVERYPGKRGIAKVRAILAEARVGADITKSEFEDAFLRFVKRNRLPAPAINALVHTATKSYECDLVWRQHRVVVELDGYAAHGTRRRFEDDRARDRALHVAEWRVVRVTWRQFQRERAAVLADLRALLPSTSTKRSR